LMAILPLF